MFLKTASEQLRLILMHSIFPVKRGSPVVLHHRAPWCFWCGLSPVLIWRRCSGLVDAGRGRPGQDQHGRVCAVARRERWLRLWRRAQPLRPRPHHRRRAHIHP